MAKTDVFADLESNVQSYARSFPVVLDHARGAHVWNVVGRRYVDFLAGAGSLNYGHNDPVCREALIQYIQDEGIAHSLDLRTAAKQRFLEAMRDIVLVPRDLDYVLQFPGPTGTNAVEAALKLARKVTGRTDVVSFTNAFHGVSVGALAVSGNAALRDAAGIPLTNVTRIPYDGYLGEDVDTLDYFEKLLYDPSSGLHRPAAVIVETIQGEGGLNAARPGWLQRLESICRAAGIVLIVDDIQAGCGRSGQFFSFEESGIKPDIVLLSKSLSGYGLPLSVVLLRKELDEWGPGVHNDTFGGNDHAFVTATAVLDHYWRTETFSKQILAKGEMLRDRLEQMAETFRPHLCSVVGRGMMRGVTCKDPKRATAVTRRAFELGLIIERCGARGQVIQCMAPLNIKLNELQEGLDILEQALADELCRTDRPARPPRRVSERKGARLSESHSAEAR